MTKLTESQISILADYYSSRYDPWEDSSDLYDAISKHSDESKYFRYKCLIKKVSKIWKEPIKLFIAKLIKTIRNFYIEQTFINQRKLL